MDVPTDFSRYGAGGGGPGGGPGSLPDNIYCDLVTTLNSKCVQTSLLEAWRYKATANNNLGMIFF